jgi:hypothetical protein
MFQGFPKQLLDDLGPEQVKINAKVIDFSDQVFWQPDLDRHLLLLSLHHCHGGTSPRCTIIGQSQ